MHVFDQEDRHILQLAGRSAGFLKGTGQLVPVQGIDLYNDLAETTIVLCRDPANGDVPVAASCCSGQGNGGDDRQVVRSRAIDDIEIREPQVWAGPDIVDLTLRVVRW